MQNILLLANASAGTGNIKSKLFEYVTILSEGGGRVTVYPIMPEKGLGAEEILRECGAEYDAIICCGGDGTLNHVISAYMEYGLTAALGYIPTGSANDFAKTIGRGKVFTGRQICAAVSDGTIFRYDIGRLGERYFNYVAAFGAFTQVSYSTPREMKNAIGYGAYVLNIIKTIPEGLADKIHVRMEHDGETEEGDYLLGAISNATSVGGFQPAALRDATLDDGLFEVFLIRSPSNLIEVNETLTALLSGSVDTPGVRVFKTAEIRLYFDHSITPTIDGEEGKPCTELLVSVVPQAIPLIIPK